MAKTNGKVITRPVKPIKTGVDLWHSFDYIDQLLEDKRVDIKRAVVKVQNNRQRIDFLKLAVRAGALKQEMLALPGFEKKQKAL